MGWKEKLRNIARRGHKNIYDAVKEYAGERGVAVTDVIASAMSAYLAADEEGKDILEEAMKKGRTTGGGTGDVTAAVKLFTTMSDSMSKMFNSVNELRASVSIGSIVSDFETVTAAVQKIKTLGAEKGAGSLEDKLASSFVTGLINRITGGGLGTSGESKKTKKTGKGKVEEIEQ